MDLFKTKDTRPALAISVAFHVLIVLLLIIGVAFKMPDPPIKDQYVSVALADFGNSSTGQGDVESENPREETQQEDTPQETQTQPVETQPDPIVTQTESEVSTPSSTEETVDNTPDPEPDPQVSDALSNALNNINNSGGGDGDDGTSGNVGTQDGDIDGKGVFGDGSANGWSLSGRGMSGEPSLSESPIEEGKVVLEIFVDRDGKVKNTKRNYGLSNTSSDYLFKLAEKAAKTAAFTVKSDAPPLQKGSMTFHFKLK